MPKRVTPLSDKQIQNAKPKDKDYPLTDGDGLYVLIKKNRSKHWRFQYRIAGKPGLLSFGLYPAVTLEAAREQREMARKLIREGKNPSQERKAAKRAKREVAGNTFKAVAVEWLKVQAPRCEADHSERTLARLENHIFDAIGARPISEIDPEELLNVLKGIEAQGKNETAKKMRQACRAIFRHAKVLKLCAQNPAEDLGGMLTAQVVKHRARVPVEKIPPPLLRDIETYSRTQTRLALRLLMLTGLRQKEMIGHTRKRASPATWDEIHWDKAEWHIPRSRIKQKKRREGAPLILPLPRQALAILRELQELNTGRYIVVGTTGKPLSENTLTNALKRLGYGGRQCAHGFRGVMSTVLNGASYELDGKRFRRFDKDWIEAQQDRQDKNATRGAYNGAIYLQERADMMQWYADHLDALRDAG